MLISYLILLLFLLLCKSDCIPKPFPKHPPPYPSDCSLINCPETWFGDDFCDSCFMNLSCNFDNKLGNIPGKSVSELIETSDCKGHCYDLGCNFDLLGNQQCDESCNSSECGYDGGDCGYCADGCNFKLGTLEKLENDVCDNECNNEKCHYDRGLCNDKVCSSMYEAPVYGIYGYTQEWCTLDMLTNCQLDYQCMSQVCFNDGAEGCSETCSILKNNGICDLECNNQNCGFDDCICAPGCNEIIIGDGICNDECKNEACRHDSYDCCPDIELCKDTQTCIYGCLTYDCQYSNNKCPTCNTGCHADGSKRCNKECMTSNCWNEFKDKESECNQFELQNILLAQHIASNYDEVVTFSQCNYLFYLYNAMYMSYCIKEIDTKECGYSWGNCYLGPKYDENECEKAYGPEKWKCLKCKTNYQLGTMCFNDCPIGYIGLRALPNYAFVCILDEKATTGIQENPYKIYVQPYNPDMNSYTPDMPNFSTIGEALTQGLPAYTTIYLSTDNSNHIINPYFTSIISDTYSPLNYHGIISPKFILFQPSSCLNLDPSQSCDSISTRAKITFNEFTILSTSTVLEISTTVKFQNVDFDGSIPLITSSDLSSEVINTYKYYCPFYISSPAGLVSDKDISLPSSIFNDSNCDELKSFSFFIVSAKGHLILKDVSFSNFRRKFYSIFKLLGGKLEMINVNFENILMSSEPESAVIVSLKCENSDFCGEVYYEEGSVSYLNNGFEYDERLTFSGFFKGEAVNKVEIKSVSFEKNLVYHGNSWSLSDDEYSLLEKYEEMNGKLIYLINFNSVVISSCTFSENLVSDGLIYLTNSAGYKYPLLINPDNEAELIGYGDTHISLYDLTFEYNYSTMTTAIDIHLLGELYNIFISNLRFLHNTSTYSTLLSITSEEKVNTDWVNDATKSSIIKDKKYMNYIMPKKFATLNSLYFSQNIGVDNSAFLLKKLVNLELIDFQIQSNTLEDLVLSPDINNLILKYFIQDTNSYLKKTVNENMRYVSNILGSISEIYSLKIISLNISQNSFAATENYLDISSVYISFKISNSNVSSNISSVSTGSMVRISTYSDVTIEDTVFNANKRYEPTCSGALSVTGNLTSLTLSRTQFLNNSAATAAALLVYKVKKLTLESCVFNNNEAHTLSTAGFYYVPSKSQQNEVTITSCQFINNRSTFSSTACFAIEKSEALNSKLFFKIQGSKFISNYSGDRYSIFTIDDSVNLDHGSVISSTEFTSNNVENIGGIGLNFITGVLTIKNSQFRDNRGLNSILLYIKIGEEKNGILTRVVIEDCEISQNNGNSLIYMADSSTSSKIFTKNLNVQSNTGVALKLEYSLFVDIDSIFDSNYAIEAPGIIFNMGSLADMTNTRFSGNSSKEHAGAISVKSGSRFKCTFCNFEYNTAGYNGGVILIEQSGYAELYNSSFRFNTAGDKGSVLSILGSMINTLFQNCLIENNHSVGDSVISLIYSKATIINSIIRKNTSKGITPGISLNLSELNIHNCIFQDQSADQGAFIYTTTESTLKVYNTSFTRGYARIAGAISILNSSAYIYSSIFTDLTAVQSGGLVAYSYSIIHLNNCTFSDIHSRAYPSVIYTLTSDLEIIHSSFSNFNQTAILMASGGILNISYSSFFDGSGQPTAGFYCTECSFMVLNNTDFYNLIGETGGAINLNTAYISGTIAYIDNCTFKNNTAITGGAISSYLIQTKITHSFFEANSAVSDIDLINQGNGGAINLYCNQEDCRSELYSNTFISNSATYNGGGIYYDYIKPYSIYYNIYTDNSATYGNNIASHAMDYKVYVVTTNGTKYLFNDEFEIASGQVMENKINIELYDEIDQLVTTDSYSEASLTALTAQTTIGGVTRVKALNGVYTFQQLVITDSPGSAIDIQFDISGIDPTKLDSNILKKSYPIPLHGYVRLCRIGEYETSKQECIPCNQDTYSLQPNATLCKTCPKEAECLGADQVYPLEKYWRTGFYSATFFECFNVDACLGHENYTSYTGVCKEGYEGNLCQSCADSYSRTLDNVCVLCPDQAVNSIRLLGIAIAFGVLIVFTIRSSMKSALEGLELHSVYIRIFANYAQLVGFIGAFKLNWPITFKNLINAQDLTGSAAQQVFSVDCYLDSGNNSQADVFYQKLIFLFVTPLIILALSTLFWAILAAIKRNPLYLRSHLITTIIVLLFIVHPDIVKMTFSVFNCIEIDPGEFYLYKDLELRCWDTTHMYFVMFIGLPSLILWVIGIPTASLIILYRQKYSLTTIKLRSKLGFLYMGYKHKYYFWEIFIIYRKIAVAFIAVFLSSSSIEVQGLSVLLLIFFSYVLHAKCMPYSIDELNDLESNSIAISGLTIYCGLYFITGKMSIAAEIGFFLVIVGLNIYFVLNWMRGFIVSYLIGIMKTKPELVKRILRFTPGLFTYICKKYDKFIKHIAKVDATDKAIEDDKNLERIKDIIFRHKIEEYEDSRRTKIKNTKMTMIDIQDQIDLNLKENPTETLNLFERKLSTENMVNLFELRAYQTDKSKIYKTSPND